MPAGGLCGRAVQEGAQLATAPDSGRPAGGCYVRSEPSGTRRASASGIIGGAGPVGDRRGRSAAAWAAAGGGGARRGPASLAGAPAGPVPSRWRWQPECAHRSSLGLAWWHRQAAFGSWVA